MGYPEWHAKGFPVESSPAGMGGVSKKPETPGPLYGWPMIWTLLGIFVGGMALNLTPCVYPLIPITVSYFGGRSGSSQRALVAHGACYISGLALTNSVLGVFAALTGSLIGALLQNPFVLVFVAAILISLAASLFGFWELKLPYGLTQAASKTHAGYFGSIFMGLSMGIVAAPCIGPFVLGLLTWVASMGSPWLGFIIFFTLSLGLGLPLFFLALFSGQLSKLPRSGMWMMWVRKLMGWILVGMAAYFVRPVLPEMARVFLMAAVATAAGLHLWWIDRTKADFRLMVWLKPSVGILCITLAVWTVGAFIRTGPGVAWTDYSDSLLAEAQGLKKPVIIDFYADWCAPCRELEDVTFHHSEIVEQASKDFVMIKLDLTRKGNPVHERLLLEYAVKGVPTVVFLDRQGNERADLRVVDFLPPDQFLIRMAEAKKTVSPQI
jgi:thioredoxin:protein disulfide reductase